MTEAPHNPEMMGRSLRVDPYSLCQGGEAWDEPYRQVYLFGPISTSVSGNKEEFDALEQKVKLMWPNTKVVNPRALDDTDEELNANRLKWTDQEIWDHCMERDVTYLMTSDALIRLPNWTFSPGGTREEKIAKMFKKDILDHNLKPFHEPITREAERVVYGERQDDYAPPKVNLTRIASYWSTLFGTDVTPSQVALAMILLKVSREQHRPKRDNRVDGAGYWELLERLEVE